MWQQKVDPWFVLNVNRRGTLKKKGAPDISKQREEINCLQEEKDRNKGKEDYVDQERMVEPEKVKESNSEAAGRKTLTLPEEEKCKKKRETGFTSP